MVTLLCAKQEAGEHISSKGAYLLQYLNAYLEHINNGVKSSLERDCRKRDMNEGRAST